MVVPPIMGEVQNHQSPIKNMLYSLNYNSILGKYFLNGGSHLKLA